MDAFVDEQGRLSFADMAALARVCAKFRGGAVRVEVGPKRKARSCEQNAYYWGVVLELLSDWSGYAPEEVHEALKAKFLGSFDSSKGLLISNSTSDLDTAEYEAYLANVRKWAEGQGLFIPLPNEKLY